MAGDPLSRLRTLSRQAGARPAAPVAEDDTLARLRRMQQVRGARVGDPASSRTPSSGVSEEILADRLGGELVEEGLIRVRAHHELPVQWPGANLGLRGQPIDAPEGLVFLDTETTGLTKHPRAKSRLQPRIIEVAALVVDDQGEIMREWETFVNPGIPVPDEITGITGITNADIKDAPKFKDILSTLMPLMTSCDIAIAHNMPFDKFLIDRELSLAGVDKFPWPQHLICTVQEHVQRYGFRPSLPVLLEDETGITDKQNHRALADCRLLLNCIQ